MKQKSLGFVLKAKVDPKEVMNRVKAGQWYFTEMSYSLAWEVLVGTAGRKKPGQSWCHNVSMR